MAGQNRDPDRIQREIHETQARMSRTIDEIQTRIRPQRLMEQVSHMFGSSKGRHTQGADQGSTGRRGAASHRRMPSVDVGHVTEGMRDNMLPIALIGLGIGWLVWSTTSHPAADRKLRQAGSWARRRTGYGGNPAAAGDIRNLPDRYRNDLGMAYGSEDITATAGSEYHYRETERGSQGRGRTAALRSAASDYAGDAMETVSEYAGRAREIVAGRGDRNYSAGTGGLWDMVERHPLVSGVIGFAIGAAAGTAIPSSRYEDQYFGRYRDSLLERGAGYGSDVVGRATEVARHAAEAGYEAAREAVREDANQGQGSQGSQGQRQGGPDAQAGIQGSGQAAAQGAQNAGQDRGTASRA
ncbi:DUF3618 domain-containing protein [Arenibaculum pallidiluteum]|uniref:DUF3618 domain-containing protein n=1 Tax=Arenibaculum pallidiluteum TaxID=2812559 RepID=UPI001A972E2B|nr:DUF3618 domain-containing protein [Arenibaculum pallidiluteum]